MQSLCRKDVFSAIEKKYDDIFNIIVIFQIRIDSAPAISYRNVIDETLCRTPCHRHQTISFILSCGRFSTYIPHNDEKMTCRHVSPFA